MNRFDYAATESSGKMISGSIWAGGVGEARHELLSRGLIPVRIAQGRADAQRLIGTRAQRLTVLRSIATHIGAGLSIRRALISTERLSLGRNISSAVRDTSRLVAEGQSLTAALQHTGLIQSSVSAVVRTGERSGELTQAIELAVRHLEYEGTVVARLQGALTYPAFLLVTAVFSFAVIGFVVLPKFAEVVRDVGAQPPPTARLLLQVATLTQIHGPAVALAVASIVGVCAFAVLVPRYRRRLARVFLCAPGIARIATFWSTATAARSLGMMLCAGLQVNRALQVLAQSATSAAETTRIRAALERVTSGQTFSRSLADAGVLPPTAIPLLEVGEKTAKLGDMLMRVAAELERQATESFERVIALLQPTIVLLFGGLIAFIAALVLQTLYSVRPAL